MNALPAQLASDQRGDAKLQRSAASPTREGAVSPHALAQTVAKKEATLGFELEPDMVKDLEKILRVRLLRARSG